MHGTASDKTVVFNGDLDTAALTGYENNLLLSESADGKSCRAAAAMIALSHCNI
jgi:hypothetical protein